MQTCSICQNDLPFDSFDPRPDARTGYRSYCKDCRRAKALAFRQAHRGELAERERAYYASHWDQAKTQQAEYREAFRKENRQRAQAWREAHPETKEERLAQSRAYYRANHEKMLEQARERRQRNRDRVRNNNNRRKAWKRNAPVNDLTIAHWQEIKRAYGQRCAYCGVNNQRLTQDHVVPLAKGGSHTASNVVPACLACNISKKVKDPPTYQPLLLIASH